jgi:hypothetical protein
MKLAAVALLAGLALAAGGCTKLQHRTDRKTLDGAVSKAFKRSYAAAYRMTTARSRKGIVLFAKVACVPHGPEPRGERAWPWSCRIEWQRRDRDVSHVSRYEVRVDPRGCFDATTSDFPAKLHERKLHRPAPNPLVYIRSCP